MKKIITQLLVLSCMIVMLTLPYFVFAIETNPMKTLKTLTADTQYDTVGTDEKTVSVIAGRVVSVVLSLVGVVFISFLLYGGFLWMTDQGSEEQVGKAKNIIRNAIIGLVITVSAFAMYKVIEMLFVKTLD